MPTPTDTPRSSANRLGLDYRLEVNSMGTPPVAITDVHVHLRDAESVHLYGQVAQRFGVTKCWTMSPLQQVDMIRDTLGESNVQFIAVPDWNHPDRLHTMGDGFLDSIRAFEAIGSRIVKFWAAPRARDLAIDVGQPDLMDLNGPIRRRQMECAASLGMAIMTHVADPDTWFDTVYTDTDRYGTKEQQYEQFEQALEEFPVPWMAAHMGGWPEDLDRLDTLLERYDHLHLDTSATKWMVRTLSTHDQQRVEQFFTRWQGRLLFGSDIVAVGEHLHAGGDGGRADQSVSAEEAFDLYASRYWALRTMFERDWQGESPIADPDLHQCDPERFDPSDAPLLIGRSLSKPVLQSLYSTAALAFGNSVGMR